MSKKLLSFLLSELHTVRLVCQKHGCGGALEMTMDQLAGANQALRCPGCNSDLRTGGSGSEPFTSFGKAVQHLRTFIKTVDVEFVIPDPAG